MGWMRAISHRLGDCRWRPVQGPPPKRSYYQGAKAHQLHKIPLEGECHVPQEELKHDLRVPELILRWQGRYYEKLGENVHHRILFFYTN